MAENQNGGVTLESLAAMVEAQNKTIADQNKVISELQGKTLAAEVKEVKPPSIPKEEVEVGNKKYKFQVAKFAFPGSDKQYLAEEVITDKELLAKIVKIEGQGILRELM